MTQSPMRRNLDYEYYRWLVHQIQIPRGNTNTYEDLFSRLHDTAFVFDVSPSTAGDHNRLQDALDLRVEFMHGADMMLEHPGSMLEILIALSRRTAFTGGGYPPVWAWKLLENLKLNKASDPMVGAKADRVEDILEAVIWRTYEPDGQGGFFPLKHSTKDQTKEELWVQMNMYVTEMMGE